MRVINPIAMNRLDGTWEVRPTDDIYDVRKFDTFKEAMEFWIECLKGKYQVKEETV